jgi:hypothetical protein
MFPGTGSLEVLELGEVPLMRRSHSVPRYALKSNMTINKMKPLPEYAGNEPAIIEPSKTKTKGIHIPAYAVLCFFGDVPKEMENQVDVQIVHYLES